VVANPTGTADTDYGQFPMSLRESLQQLRNGLEIPIVTLVRTLQLEVWLRSLRDEGVWGNGAAVVTRALPRTRR
jgi:hypothetical protein